MEKVVVEKDTIKSWVKEAIVELLQERQALLYDVILEVVEEQGLIQAVREGESTPYASREEVLDALKGTECS